MQVTAHQDDLNLDEEIVDVNVWADPLRVDRIFTHLRQHDPVHWTAPRDFRPFWSVSKHDDIVEIERRSDIFKAEPRSVIQPILREQSTLELTGGSSNPIKSLVVMDAPEHLPYRLLTQDWFLPIELRKREEAIAKYAQMSIDRMREMGGSCDFARDIAIWYPLRVIMSVLGVPEEDEQLMLTLTQELFGGSDPDMMRDPNRPQVTLGETVAEFTAYFEDLTKHRRRHPKDDIATLIANAEIDGKPIGAIEALGYYIVVATAGHDTTSHTLTGGLHGLITHPDEWRKLSADIDGGMKSAVDEMIRWVAPVRHFIRTATEDYVLRNRTVRAGDAVCLWFNSACRDEDIFEAPAEFRVDRPSGRHMAFGHGPHICLGMRLARMEVGAFFQQLLDQLDSAELTEEPQWLKTSFVGGIKSMPIECRWK
jgi:cytochrome P450